MFLTINRDTLLTPLLLVTGFIEKKHTMPILSNIYMQKVGDKITIIANDMEIQASITSSEDMTGEDFTITMPGKKLQEILKAFPEGTNILFEYQDNRAIIKAGKTKFTIQCLPAEHYPLLKITDNPICEFSLPQATLKRLISHIQYSMAEKDSRVFLNGMLFEIKNNHLSLVATDAHRLGFITHPITEPVINNCSAIVPRKSVLELYRLLSDSTDNITVKLYPNQVSFTMPNRELITKVIDGKYPEYERVIPLNNEKLCLINRMTMLKAVERVAVIGIDKLRTLTVEIKNNQLALFCMNDDHEESQDEIDIISECDDINLKLSFNINYVRDLLTYSFGENLQWAFHDEQKSILITIPNETDFKAVLMPLRP